MVTDLYILESREISENRGIFVLKLNVDSVIYKAHFPGHPITPGACILLFVDELVHLMPGMVNWQMSQIVNMKFLNPIDPTVSDEIIVDLSCDIETCHVKAEVKHNAGTASRLSIKYKQI